MKNLLKEIATRKRIETIISFGENLPDPDKILKANNYNYEIYRELLNDTHLTAVITQRKMQVLQMGWELESAEEIKSELLELISKWNINKIGSEILDVLLYGFVAMEIIWEKDKNKFIPKDLIEKPQEWFIFNKENELRLRKKSQGYYSFFEGEKLDENKFIILQNNPNYNNPYGEKLLSKIYWLIKFKQTAIESWHDLADKFGIPFLVGYYTPTATPEEKTELINLIEQMIQNRIGLLKEGTVIDFKEEKKYEVGQIFNSFLEFLNREISKAILTETLTTEINKTGSYNAAQIHKEILEYIGLFDKKYIEMALSEMLRKYVKINYGKNESVRIRLKKKESIIESTIERDKILATMGIKFTRDYYKKRYNLKEEDFEKK